MPKNKFGRKHILHINLNQNIIITIKLILGCDQSELSTKYLGLPLTINHRTELTFNQWYKRFSKGWRVGNPIFYLMGERSYWSKRCYQQYRCIICKYWRYKNGQSRKLIKCEEIFLWKGNDPCSGLNCLVNWDRVCTIKSNGGLGIIRPRTPKRSATNKVDMEIAKRG